jgi:Fe-S cluster biogenesis protein NfuA
MNQEIIDDKGFETAVTAMIEQSINPALNAHGGFAKLVKIDGRDVHLELGGGCKGCPGARATVRYGIENALRENVPGMGRVIDVTDHGFAAPSDDD